MHSCITDAEPAEGEWVLPCQDEDTLLRAGWRLAALLAPGDTLLLRGALGAGKTTLARGVVQALHSDRRMRVTSPSYLLCNVYDVPHTAGAEGGTEGGADTEAEAEAVPLMQVHHMDLYRLPTAGDVSFLGIPAVFNDTPRAVCLVEWPQRLASADMPQRCVSLCVL
jgi:tRNA A37 threonylcarbamoyladenosine biosynthesis protein TsaE